LTFENTSAKLDAFGVFMDNDIQACMSVAPLGEGAEMILTTNVKTPLELTGVAEARVRDGKGGKWRTSRIVLYRDCGEMKKAEVNAELYSALHLVFQTLSNLDDNPKPWERLEDGEVE
jgi:hypothetical protein